jgi:hypothetical protein
MADNGVEIRRSPDAKAAAISLGGRNIDHDDVDNEDDDDEDEFVFVFVDDEDKADGFSDAERD